ncbi:MAG: hypothetical protein ACREJN_01045 [Nitrospiraceae bacterium]
MVHTMRGRLFVLPVVMGICFMMPVVGNAGTELSKGHKQVMGVVTAETEETLAVETPTGSMTLNKKSALRHGHEVPKIGDELVLTLNENNTVIEAHPKGDAGAHRFVTGKLVYVGKMKKEIKLLTSEGEQVFPISRLEMKTKPIEEGAMVTAEVNEGGEVIDLHRAESGKPKH